MGFGLSHLLATRVIGGGFCLVFVLTSLSLRFFICKMESGNNAESMGNEGANEGASKGAWNTSCLRKMLGSFTYSFPQLPHHTHPFHDLPPPLPPSPPPCEQQPLPASGYSGYFPQAWKLSTPALKQAEARACAESGKAALVGRARLGKGGGERREGGKERTAENLERLREGGRGEKGWGGVRKEGWVGTEERQ